MPDQTASPDEQIPIDLSDTVIKKFYNLSGTDVFWFLMAFNVVLITACFALGIYFGYHLILLGTFPVVMAIVVGLGYKQYSALKSFQTAHLSALEEIKTTMQQNPNVTVVLHKLDLRIYLTVIIISALLACAAVPAGARLTRAEGLKLYFKQGENLRNQ